MSSIFPFRKKIILDFSSSNLPIVLLELILDYFCELPLEDEKEIEVSIENKNVEELTSLACVYKDMELPQIAQPLFALAQQFALASEYQIPARYRTFWGETLLRYSDKALQDYGIQIIIEAAVEDDAGEAVEFLVNQNDIFKNYIRQKFGFDLLTSLKKSTYWWYIAHKIKFF